jgi:hypothetical protein
MLQNIPYDFACQLLYKTHSNRRSVQFDFVSLAM